MARINIEEELWADPRFERLQELLGDGALHALVRFWRYCQKQWIENKMIPKKFFSSAFKKELLECGFAIEDGDGIMCVGADKHFGWLKQKIDAGRRGGIVRSEQMRHKVQAVPKRSLSEPQAVPTPQSQSQSQSQEENIVSRKSKETHQLLKLWNQHMVPQFAPVRGCSAARLQRARSRWRDHPIDSFWIELFDKIKANKFLSGNNDRGWKANFDWLIRPDTVDKVLEGSYGGEQTKVRTRGIAEILAEDSA